MFVRIEYVRVGNEERKRARCQILGAVVLLVQSHGPCSTATVHQNEEKLQAPGTYLLSFVQRSE